MLMLTPAAADVLNPTLPPHNRHRYGCIPVAATDFLYEAFEPELDWGHFGVKVAQWDIPKLGQLLEAYTEEQLQVKQVSGQGFRF